MRAGSIKTKLILAVSGLVLALMVVLSTAMFAYHVRKSKELISASQYAMASLLANEIDDRLSSAHQQIVALATLVKREHLRDPDKAQGFLEAYVRTYAVFGNGIVLYDSDGVMLAASPQSQYRGQSFKFREYMSTTLATKKPFIGEYLSSRAHRHPALMLTAPVFDAPGELIGVVTGSIDLVTDNVLGRCMSMHNGETGYFYVVNHDRKILAHRDQRRIFEQVAPGANVLFERAIAGFEGTEETTSSRGVRTITSFKRLKTRDWLVGASFPVAEAYAPIRQARRVFLLFFAATALLVPIVVWNLMNWLTRPLVAFTTHVESISEKTGDARLYGVRSHDEIGRLTRAFDAMVTDLDGQRAEIESQRERLSITLRSIADGVVVTDLDGRIVLVNRAAEQLTGWAQADALGAPLGEVLVLEDEKTGGRLPTPAPEGIARSAVVTLAPISVLVSRDGARRFVSDSCAPVRDSSSKIIGAVFVFRDVTEKRMAEEQRARVDKLESVGLLAGGIAHDYNNLLTVILGSVSLAKLSPCADPELGSLLDSVERATLQGRDLAHQLLTFSKGGTPVKRTSSIAELVEDALSFALRGSNVRPSLSLPGDLWLVDVDRGQMHQVLSNLSINAKQAMPDGGVLDVRGANRLLEHEQHELPPGRYVQISVHDTGSGIQPDHLSRVFDPYFTTKADGSGLGLATAYAIVRKHHGTITVRSTPGEGTTFDIYLPGSDRPRAEGAAAERDVRVGTGSILVMDDDDLVRNTLRRILRSLGYRVECASEGSEAVRCYSEAMESGSPFDLVIMDLTVPGGMGGKEALQELKRLHPQVRAIVSSGYSNDPVLASFQDFGFSGAVLKPFRVAELSEQVQQVIGSKAKPSPRDA
jgi:PAS domain S-box-containing protein